MTWVRCECGCGWEGEDEVTQLLVEEAIALKMRALEREAFRSSEDREADELMGRHAELVALRERMGR